MKIKNYKKTVVSLKKIPDDLTVIYLLAILMPNREIIFRGKSLGFFTEEDIEYIYKEKQNENI